MEMTAGDPRVSTIDELVPELENVLGWLMGADVQRPRPVRTAVVVVPPDQTGNEPARLRGGATAPAPKLGSGRLARGPRQRRAYGVGFVLTVVALVAFATLLNLRARTFRARP